MKFKIFVMLFIVSAVASWGLAKPNIAIVTENSPAYKKASLSSDKIYQFNRGDAVFIIDAAETRSIINEMPALWYRVKNYNDIIAWIPSSKLSFASSFARNFFQTSEQYSQYIRMAARKGEQVIAAYDYQKVKKGDLGYIFSISDDPSLNLLVVWEHNLDAKPGREYIPADFPTALLPYVYFVDFATIELTGKNECATLFDLAKNLPVDFPQPDDFYASSADVDLPWYLAIPDVSFGTDLDDIEAESPYLDYDSTTEPETVFTVSDISVTAESYGHIKVGSVVILGRHTNINGGDSWDPKMDAFVGKEAVVEKLTGIDEQGFLTIKVAGTDFLWRARNIEVKGQGIMGSYGYKVGDSVIIASHRYIDGDNNWDTEMDKYSNKTAVITRFDGFDTVGCLLVRLDIDKGAWSWRIETMSPAK